MFPVEKFKDLETPFYFYDTKLLRKTLSAIRSAVQNSPHFHVHYAVKANANPRLLAIIKEQGFGADCVSGGEVAASIAAGFEPEDVVFAGVGKSDREIRLALEAGIACFNVESIPELEVISELAAEMNCVARVAFRINPNVDAHTHEKITTGLNENKFGIAARDVLAAIRKAEQLPGLEYSGLHFHIGSQILDLSVFQELCLRINALQTFLDTEGIVTKSINVGGGLGIDYDRPLENQIPDFAAYFDVFKKNLLLREGQELHFELGRSIVGQCGTLVARALYIKQGATKQFVIVDAGFTDLIRPAMYDANHEILNLTSQKQEVEKYDVVGPICESSDVFKKDALLPTTERGDLIAFCSAGAYGEVMASTYNCRTLPKAYTLEDFA